MAGPHIHPKYRTVTASVLLGAIGASLAKIKEQDGATDADLGRVIGKSADRVRAYRDGAADMGVVSLLFGIERWDGRFVNDALALVGMKLTPIDAGEGCDRASVSALCALLSKKAAAVENDGVIDDAELEDMWPELEAAARHIDRLRARRRGLHVAASRGARVA